MKHIFVLYTGGTIGMTETAHGLAPDTAIVQTALTPFSGSLKFDWHICNPLIDSSAVTPHDWAQWLHILQQQIPHYDGVLVLHGTDTLAYTANLLALALNTGGKPVILTGAQKPFSNPGSDAPANLNTAVDALLRDDIHEVLLAFNGQLFAAVGSSKISTETDNGFGNSHFGTWQPQQATPQLSSSLNKRFDPDIHTAALLLTPGWGSKAAAAVLQHNQTDAAALLSYGHGNAPADADLLHAAEQFAVQGKILLNISQVPQGCAAAVYAQGSALRRAGVINGGKCTVETAIVLLMLAAANRWTPQQMQQALCDLHLTD